MINKLKNIYHLAWAWGATIWYGRPGGKIKVIGITGTKGKTTSAHLIAHVLREAGEKVALLSSVEVAVENKRQPNKTGNTMPGRWFIQKWLARAVKANCQWAVLEVTSQGVLQSRHRFIGFDYACFTGIHPEHIEAHGGFENYKKAKLKFFREARQTGKKTVFFVNQKDKYVAEFKKAAGVNKIISYSPEEAKNIEVKKLAGDLNKGNIALTKAIAKEIKISEEKIKTGLESFPGLPGRMEVIQKEPVVVVIDYAYTPESVELAYQALIKFKKEGGKMIAVFGAAGGGRDKWKRPELGRIAEEWCEKIILTEEEPYDESAQKIAEEIAKGIKDKNKYEIIIDREEAIRRAAQVARPGDVIALLGKGPEPYIHYNNKKIPWDERRVAEKILKEKSLH